MATNTTPTLCVSFGLFMVSVLQYCKVIGMYVHTQSMYNYVAKYLSVVYIDRVVRGKGGEQRYLLSAEHQAAALCVCLHNHLILLDILPRKEGGKGAGEHGYRRRLKTRFGWQQGLKSRSHGCPL